MFDIKKEDLIFFHSHNFPIFVGFKSIVLKNGKKIPDFKNMFLKILILENVLNFCQFLENS